MVKNALHSSDSVAGAKPGTPGMMARVGSKIRSSLIDTILGHIWQLAVITPVLGYLGSWYAGLAPSPEQIVQRIGNSGSDQATPPRSLGIAEVKALGSDAAAQTARAIQVPLTGRLRPMPEAFGGVRVQYALGPITSGRGATSATSVRWALAATGTGWLTCPEVPVSFTSPRSLAEEVASQINNSLLASEIKGELQCG